MGVRASVFVRGCAPTCPSKHQMQPCTHAGWRRWRTTRRHCRTAARRCRPACARRRRTAQPCRSAARRCRRGRRRRRVSWTCCSSRWRRHRRALRRSRRRCSRCGRAAVPELRCSMCRRACAWLPSRQRLPMIAGMCSSLLCFYRVNSLGSASVTHRPCMHVCVHACACVCARMHACDPVVLCLWGKCSAASQRACKGVEVRPTGRPHCGLLPTYGCLPLASSSV